MVGTVTAQEKQELPELEGKLAAIVGDDLAGSLIRAALRRGEWGLDMQLAINDGLAQLDPVKRRRALELIDQLLTHTRTLTA